MAQFETLDNAYLLIKDGRIADFGSMESLPQLAADVKRVDAEGGTVMPSFCDSHTHIVNAGSRESEFVDKSTDCRMPKLPNVAVAYSTVPTNCTK